jgi:hypothetical protein
MEKWKVPACFKCNQDYGKLEEDLLWRLGLSVDPTEQASLGVTDKVLRSVKPALAESPKDAKARQNKLKKILAQLSIVSSPPPRGLLPNFGLIPGLQYPEIVQIPIDDDALVRLGQKVIRGLTYIATAAMIDPYYAISIYFLEDDKGADFVSLVKQRGVVHEKGPGITVAHATSDEGGLSSLWYIEIWGKLKMYGTVIPAHLKKVEAA